LFKVPPDQVLATAHKEVSNQVLSDPAHGVWDETPEMKHLREKSKTAINAEEAEHYLRKYEKLASQRMAYYSS
jgi:hypothetical protein